MQTYRPSFISPPPLRWFLLLHLSKFENHKLCGNLRLDPTTAIVPANAVITKEVIRLFFSLPLDLVPVVVRHQGTTHKGLLHASL